MARLDDAAIATALQGLSGWWREGEVLVRTYRRRDWADAVAFLDRIAPEAEGVTTTPTCASPATAT